jgi:hypothetical protein
MGKKKLTAKKTVTKKSKKVASKKKPNIHAIKDVFGAKIAATSVDPSSLNTTTCCPPLKKAYAKSNKKKRKNRRTIKFAKPFDLLIALTLVDKVIAEKKEKMLPGFKTAAFSVFEQMLLNGERPDLDPASKSFKAKCDEFTALFSLKMKNIISEDLAKTLDKYKVPYKVHKSSDSSNPPLQLNQELFYLPQEKLAKLAEAIKGVKELQGIQVFTPQDPLMDATAYAMSDDTLPAVMAIKNVKERTKILKALTTLAFSAQMIDGETEESDKAIAKALLVLSQKGVLSVGLK